MHTDLHAAFLEFSTVLAFSLDHFQLDIKTKLCIRDSLYRLAQSAEQRHCANPNVASNGAATVEESNK